ncbi:MAG TPA: ADP-glyceromanno-heptose 6-epimerase [Gemmatimonas aurantiaca]|uniref:ADP-L-glycero-D-manno-heptose-6-epimerase n=2 Tax=Gemmatimonas aurantiaca TaxID=173480 RepID=C1ACL5_GEMAT|nr:ADP-glyceromanno-heptose 6-epimerase [Gemmatimonas aurantiaca]BAH40242.1 ADP-L-glycero-D-manno-heptose-6-epimerase [Gemmatimonas aurantiaca T-27]HCT57748.1 ADP-glyceromanno-heptose 6-epimerase [Gemmatimonas aurantiaca]
MTEANSHRPLPLLSVLDTLPTRVLVTGGAGFIGSALVWALNQQGVDRIVIADRLGQDEKWRNLVPLRFEDYLEADDLFPRLESGALGDFDLILHLGACSATTELDATYLARNNFEFTKQLAHRALARGSRFVYASSAATYGDGAHGMDDIDNSSAALSRLRPLNAYGYSKHLFDQYAAQAGLLHRIVGLKYFNVYGPNEAHKGDMRSLVHKAFGQIRDTGRVRLFRSHRVDYKDGEQQRDFLYVKDAVAMTLHLAMSPAAGGLYNIGSGQAHSWLELTGALFAALGREPEIEFIDIPESIRAKYQYHTKAEIAKLRAAGYAALVTPLADAVRDYVQGYLTDDRRLGD